MPRCNKKSFQEANCYDLAIQRMRHVFKAFDRPVVLFSGGKDSTACLNIALQVARETGNTPLHVVSYDEEAIPPETVEYMERVASIPDIHFKWMCLPIEHRNACSRKEPYWYCWDPDKKDLWCRPFPERGIAEWPGFKKGMAADKFSPILYGPEHGRVCFIMGIRTDESLSRFRAVAVRKGERAFMTGYDGNKHAFKAYPVYDWKAEDIWLAPKKFGWDYNHAYDVMQKSGYTLAEARCAPPYGEQPIRGLHKFKTCWPHLWSRMVNRVHGAATAARYANTELYGFGNDKEQLPEGMTWQDYTMSLVEQLQGKSKTEVSEGIRTLLGTHARRSSDPMPDNSPHPESGFCWRFICKMAIVGGNKFGRISQKISNMALAELAKRNPNYGR